MRGFPTGNSSFLILEVMAEDKKKLHPGHYLAIGIALGLCIGAAMGNIPIGICIGAGLGTAYAANAKKKENKEK